MTTKTKTKNSRNVPRTTIGCSVEAHQLLLDTRYELRIPSLFDLIDLAASALTTPEGRELLRNHLAAVKTAGLVSASIDTDELDEETIRRMLAEISARLDRISVTS
jgi:hypothetical protein